MNYTRDCRNSVTVLLTVKTVRTVSSVRVERGRVRSRVIDRVQERVLCDQCCVRRVVSSNQSEEAFGLC